jgi:hypothetical protein
MSEEENKEEVKMTPEEYAKKRADNLAHLKKEVEYLKVEKTYENLVADVEEAKTRGISHIAQRAQFFAQQNVAAQQPPAGSDGPPPNQPAPEGPPEAKPPRKLKPQKPE